MSADTLHESTRHESTRHDDSTAFMLAPGTPLILTPAGAPAAVGLAEVISWSASPTGLVVTAWAATSEVTAVQLDDQHVWMAGRTVDDVLIVLEAVSRRAGPGELELTSVWHVATEYRRAAIRASVAFPAVLRTCREPGDRAVAAGHVLAVGDTIDISRDGCRLRFPAPAAMPVSTRVETSLDLGAAGTLRAPGTVVRCAPDSRQMIVRFDVLPIEDAAMVDRVVFAALRA